MNAPPATPIQVASWHLAEAFRAAQADRATFESFCEIAIVRLAEESVRLLDRKRPW